MGPRSQQHFAEVQDETLNVLGNILTELKFQRVNQARIMASLGIEIDDRKAGDEQLERRLKEHDTQIRHLAIAPDAE